MHRTRCAAALAAVAALGCSAEPAPQLPPPPGVAEPDSSSQPDERRAEQEGEGTSDVSQVAGPAAPLTGVPIGEGRQQELAATPLVAVKVENQLSSFPQHGTGDADLIVEHLVEGGHTRLTALFHTTQPEQVGPVRSARLIDADLLAPLDGGVLAHTGGRIDVLGALATTGVGSLQHGQTPGMFRSTYRTPPDNVFADLAELGSHAEHPYRPTSHLFHYSDTPPAGGQTVSGRVEVAMSPVSRSTWRWEPRLEGWLKTLNGEPHNSVGAQPLAPANVIVLDVEADVGDARDTAGNPTTRYDLTGTGTATLYRDGKSYPARWRKDAPVAPLRLESPDGASLLLAPGPSYLQLRPR